MPRKKHRVTLEAYLYRHSNGAWDIFDGMPVKVRSGKGRYSLRIVGIKDFDIFKKGGKLKW